MKRLVFESQTLDVNVVLGQIRDVTSLSRNLPVVERVANMEALKLKLEGCRDRKAACMSRLDEAVGHIQEKSTLKLRRRRRRTATTVPCRLPGNPPARARPDSGGSRHGKDLQADRRQRQLGRFFASEGVHCTTGAPSGVLAGRSGS